MDIVLQLTNSVNIIISHSGIRCASDTQAYCLQVSLFVITVQC